ncbi:hypothetical protein [Mucilaginibacter paludis]|uniref:Uncharacterized protein n=1 Tax=Mucilaginibacter paludis DSM 18603 TaxID=714943 RepID=H1YHM5_9SPHI|nr:hypothetical protein [Mucilaginibacter paludis]EHQ26448.1 hypothetical protein Mucpa_2318 [Mucilaginibacter paludis DSM 18603]
MNDTSFKLLAWVTESIAPAELSGSNLTTADFENWKTLLKSESTEWRIAISSYLLGMADDDEKLQYLKAQQIQLTLLSNKLNQYLCRDQKIWSGHKWADQIRTCYRKSLAVCEELLSFTVENFPEYSAPNLKVTDYKLIEVLPNLRNRIYGLKTTLLNTAIDPILAQLIVKGMSGLLTPGKLTIAGKKYLNCLIYEITGLEIFSTDHLIDLLIRLNFNQPEFYLYLTDSVNKKRFQIDGLHEEYEYILQEREVLNNKKSLTGLALYPGQLPVKLELQQFYNEKAIYLEELLSHRRKAIQDKLEAERAFRMLIDIPVPVFALFVRMLKETKFILKTGITEMCTFFAIHFYTDKAPFISSANLLKRSTDVEFTTVLKLWDLLTFMLDWLDLKFNVRSIKRSIR